jgi:hypothetical protein
MNPPGRLSSSLPDRGEVIWINHNPQAGRERKDHHLKRVCDAHEPMIAALEWQARSWG